MTARVDRRFVRVRQQLYPPVDNVARATINKYRAYELPAREHVGSVDQSVVQVRQHLVELGYEFGYLSALKYHWEKGAPDSGSYRRVDPAHPRWQWHVHLFELGNTVDVASHYEYRPDLRCVAGETHPERVQRLREHYRPTWDTLQDDGATYFLGDCCSRVAVYLVD